MNRTVFARQAPKNESAAWDIARTYDAFWPTEAKIQRRGAAQLKRGKSKSGHLVKYARSC
jgi:hypothetical protein